LKRAKIFGPIDIVKLREGKVITVTAGMLPEAEFAFLDELFNANSAILSSLLTILNERVFRRGLETHQLPLLSQKKLHPVWRARKEIEANLEKRESF